ncbi:MAG: hypothetical protein AAGG01_16570, partial [Planctomycetota bacterium]
EGVRAAFLPTGTIVAASDTHDRSLRTHQRRVERIAERMRSSGEAEAVALVGTPSPTSYLVIDRLGVMTLLRFQGV